MLDLLYHLISLLFFDITLFYYYSNLSLLIVCFFFFLRYMHISVGISLSSPIFPSSFVTISELLYSEVFGTFEIISAVLLLIKSPVYSVAF